MKRSIALLLAICLIMSFAGCGNKEPEGPPEPTDWVVSTEYITQRLVEYAASEELRFMLDNHKALVDYHGHDKTYGPYLTGAAEVYALYGDGQGYRFILMYIEGDFQLAIGEYFMSGAVVYDIDSGLFYDSLSQNRPELSSHYAAIRDTAMHIAINGGTNYAESLANIPYTFGSSQNPGYVFTRELTAEEVASINTELGLEPVPYRGPEAKPEIHTTAEERHNRIVDAVKQFAGSDQYYTLYPDGTIPLVQASSEMAEELSLWTHALVIKLEGADTTGGQQDEIVVDMKTDLVYTYGDFDEDWVSLDSPEKVAYLLADVYDYIVSGAEEFFWSNGTETNIMLSHEEIVAINQELTDYFSENPIAPPPTELPAEPEAEQSEEPEFIPEAIEQPKEQLAELEDNTWSISDQFVIDTLRNIQKTDDYQFCAADPTAISLNMAYQYYVEDFEGFEVHLVMLRLNGIDRSLHGYSGDVFLVEPATGKIYSNYNVDLDGWDAFKDMEDIYAAILSAWFWEDPGVTIWTDIEILIPIPQKNLDAVNSALAD